MSGGAEFHFHCEWPPPGAVVRGPEILARGWLVGVRVDFTDLRARVGAEIFAGLLGFPRADVARHLGSARPWLPAGFSVPLNLPAGDALAHLEALDAWGRWHALPALAFRVGPEGAPAPEIAPLPPVVFSAPSDPVASVAGACAVAGTLPDGDTRITAIFASADLLVFNHLVCAPAADSAERVAFSGAVDLPPTPGASVCLRVFARFANEEVRLIAARRIGREAAPPVAPAASGEKIALPRVEPLTLPPLPSGRPRRLLIGLHDLEVTPGNRRALEVVEFLHAGHEWAARFVTGGAGEADVARLEARGVSVQPLDGRALFAAGDEAAVASALAALDRQIWWTGLDAVAVFDPRCFWLIALARRRGLPVLLDCAHEMAPVRGGDFPLAVEVAAAKAWWSATVVCHRSEAGARQHAALFGEVPAEVIPPWTSPQPATGRSAHEFIVAPVGGTARHGARVLLRAVDWLARRGSPPPWRVAVTRIEPAPEEMGFVHDAVLNRPTLMAVEQLPVTSAAAAVCPAEADHPVADLLDAAAAGVPIVTTPSPELDTIFDASEVVFVPPGQPLALAHALADLAANRDAATRRAERARARVQAHHTAKIGIGRWQRLLESMVARRGA